MEKAGAVQASVFFIGIFPDGHRPVQFFRQAERSLRYGPQDKPHVHRFSLCAFRCGTLWQRWSFCADGADAGS